MNGYSYVAVNSLKNSVSTQIIRQKIVCIIETSFNLNKTVRHKVERLCTEWIFNIILSTYNFRRVALDVVSFIKNIPRRFE